MREKRQLSSSRIRHEHGGEKGVSGPQNRKIIGSFRACNGKITLGLDKKKVYSHDHSVGAFAYVG